MITDNDVKKLKKVFVTKQELKDELRYMKEDLLDKMDRSINQIDGSINQKFSKFRDEILKAVAEMLHIGVDPIFNDHEERIKKIEKRVFPAA
ncbi:hypothetical protein HY031_02465 [Candidatus Gottesmanbacteria bacterium]|nr:hypothetical protein [Candidatus Gottesmanbacteria bacterium]